MKAKQIQISRTFKPKFWEDSDGRTAIVREIRRRVDELKQDCRADSMQKSLLCERAVFVALQLETQEIEAVKTGHINHGSYVQACNCLIGLLKALGLNRQAKKVPSLERYIEQVKDNR